MSDSLAGRIIPNATVGQEKLFVWQRSTLRKPIFRYQQTAALLGPTLMRNQDVALDIFIESGKIKTPYERGIAWESCMFLRWAESDCIPGVGSKVYIDNPMTDEELHDVITKQIESNKSIETIVRPYILVVHGNDQYISIYPDSEEIGPDHQHRKRVEAHFAERGLKYVAQTPIIKWADFDGQDSNLNSVGRGPSGYQFGPGFNFDFNYFYTQLVDKLSITPISSLSAGFLHAPSPENPRPQTQDSNSGEPPS